jgi:hypothetical protein
MRRLLVTVVVVTLVGGAAYAAAAAANRGGGTTPLKCMDTLWRTSKVSTSSRHFATVPGFRDAPPAIFPITVTVSAVVSGAPVKFRVLSTNVGGQTHPSKPGTAPFVPKGGRPEAFGYQWIERNQAAAVHSNRLRLQWRSPNGHPVHLLRGDMSVQYAADGCIGSS